MSEPPPCLECGACCFSDLPDYVRVDGDDYARLGDDAEAWVSWKGNRCYLRMHEGHCAALQVEPGGRFVCAIYELRPATCRELERGSPACAGERDAKVGRTRRALGLYSLGMLLVWVHALPLLDLFA